MIRPGHVLAAAAAAALTYKITHAQRHGTQPDFSAIVKDAVGAYVAGIPGATLSDAEVEENLAATAICDGLQNRNWTKAELAEHAEMNDLLSYGDQS